MISRNKQFALLVIALIGAGCSSGDNGNTTAPPPPPPPPPELSTGPDSCSGGMAGDFACSGISLRKRVPNDAMGGGDGNDIWGWVDAQTDNEYALMGLTNGTAFVDVTDPDNPVFLGHLATNTTEAAWRDIKVYLDHAFIVADGAGAHGMQVFNLTRLRTAVPPESFMADAIYDGFENAHNLAINEATGYAYAVGTNKWGLRGLVWVNPELDQV